MVDETVNGQIFIKKLYIKSPWRKLASRLAKMFFVRVLPVRAVEVHIPFTRSVNQVWIAESSEYGVSWVIDMSAGTCHSAHTGPSTKGEALGYEIEDHRTIIKRTDLRGTHAF